MWKNSALWKAFFLPLHTFSRQPVHFFLTNPSKEKNLTVIILKMPVHQIAGTPAYFPPSRYTYLSNYELSMETVIWLPTKRTSYVLLMIDTYDVQLYHSESRAKSYNFIWCFVDKTFQVLTFKLLYLIK